MNKLIITVLFVSLISFSINESFAQIYTDKQIQTMYPNEWAIQSDVDNCKIQWNQLPDDIKPHIRQIDICPNITTSANSNPLSMFVNNNMIILIILLIVGIVIAIGGFALRSSTKDDTDYYEENKQSKLLSEDKVNPVSMDNIKTKEEHPMGDKTHD